MPLALMLASLSSPAHREVARVPVVAEFAVLTAKLDAVAEVARRGRAAVAAQGQLKGYDAANEGYLKTLPAFVRDAQPHAEAVIDLARLHPTDPLSVGMIDAILVKYPELPAAEDAANLAAKYDPADGRIAATVDLHCRSPFRWVVALARAQVAAATPDRRPEARVRLAILLAELADTTDMLAAYPPTTEARLRLTLGNETIDAVKQAGAKPYRDEALGLLRSVKSEFGGVPVGRITYGEWASELIGDLTAARVGAPAPAPRRRRPGRPRARPGQVPRQGRRRHVLGVVVRPVPGRDPGREAAHLANARPPVRPHRRQRRRRPRRREENRRQGRHPLAHTAQNATRGRCRGELARPELANRLCHRRPGSDSRKRRSRRGTGPRRRGPGASGGVEGEVNGLECDTAGASLGW